MRVVGEHVGGGSQAPRLQVHLLGQLPVVEAAAAQPVQGERGVTGAGRVPTRRVPPTPPASPAAAPAPTQTLQAAAALLR